MQDFHGGPVTSLLLPVWTSDYLSVARACELHGSNRVYLPYHPRVILTLDLSHPGRCPSAEPVSSTLSPIIDTTQDGLSIDDVLARILFHLSALQASPPLRLGAVGSRGVSRRPHLCHLACQVSECAPPAAFSAAILNFRDRYYSFTSQLVLYSD